MYIYYNGEFMAKGIIKHTAAGFQYGHGVFETILVRQGVPCFFEMHFERLTKASDSLGLKLELSVDEMQQQAVKLASLCSTQEGRLKIISFRDEDKDALMMTISHYQREERKYEQGYSLMTSSIRRNPYSPLCYLKSLNYMESILAKEEAKQQGYDEALLMNVHGKLCEGSMSNLFWFRGDTLFTPEVSCGLLKGITRKQVMEICHRLSIKLRQGTYTLSDLENADEVFVTNSLMGIMPVGSVDNIIYNKNDRDCTQTIVNEYNKLLEAYIDKGQKNKASNEEI